MTLTLPLNVSETGIFHDRLHLLDDVEGHHLGLVLLHSIALFFFCAYLYRLLGPVAAAAGTVALALFPSALASSFNNPKDWPCAQYYGIALLAAGLGVISGRARHLMWAAVFLGVALACKFNAVFVLPTFYLWLPIAYAALYWRRRRMAPSVAAMVFGFPYVSVFLFFLFWPWLLHGDSVAVWWDHVSEYVHYMAHNGIGDRPYWSSYSLQALLFMTPPLVLALAAIQMAFGWSGTPRRPRSEALAVGSLLLLWTALPVLREALPRTRYYDANRHFIEYVPGLCAMAGAGADRVVTSLRAAYARWRLPERTLSTVLGLAAVSAAGCLVWPIVAYRPYEIAYYNSLTGGLGGAQRHPLFVERTGGQPRPMGGEGDYWYSTTREAIALSRPYLSESHTFGACGPVGCQVALNRGDLDQDLHMRVSYTPHELDGESVVFAVPQAAACRWSAVRELERDRPILHRVERDNGLVYEILGARDGKEHPVVTAQNPEAP